MKTRNRKHLSVVVAALVMSGILVSEAGASDGFISSADPALYFNDTSYLPVYEWDIAVRNNVGASNDYFDIYDKIYSNYAILLYNTSTDVRALQRLNDGDIKLSDGAIKIEHSANKNN